MKRKIALFVTLTILLACLVVTAQPSHVSADTTPCANWWLAGGVDPSNVVAAYQPMGASSLSDSYINLANPGTYNAAPGVAPTWDATNGWISSGAEYLTTNIPFSSSGSFSMIVRFSNIGSAANDIAGGMIGWNYYFVIAPRTGSVNYFYGDTKSSTSLSSGVLALAGPSGYKNGVLDVSSIGSGPFSGTIYPLYLLAYHDESNVAEGFYSGYVQAFAFYNIIISETQVSSITNAMNGACPTATPTQTFTPSNTLTATNTTTNTFTPSHTPTKTNTATDTATNTFTPSDTPTDTLTPSDTATLTPAFTFTPSVSPTITDTPTITLTPTDTLEVVIDPTITKGNIIGIVVGVIIAIILIVLLIIQIIQKIIYERREHNG